MDVCLGTVRNRALILLSEATALSFINLITIHCGNDFY